MEANRRSYNRHEVYTAIGIDSEERKNRAGITRNVSAGGVLFHSRSRFQLGETLELRMRAPLGSQCEYRVRGVVVRVASERPDSPFPHLTAVSFVEPLEALESPVWRINQRYGPVKTIAP